jgi:hypothetical protein
MRIDEFIVKFNNSAAFPPFIAISSKFNELKIAKISPTDVS